MKSSGSVTDFGNGRFPSTKTERGRQEVAVSSIILGILLLRPRLYPGSKKKLLDNQSLDALFVILDIKGIYS